MTTNVGGESDVPQWLITIGASAVTAIGGFVLAIINRAPAFQSAIQAATHDLIEGFRQHNDQLLSEVKQLRDRVDELEDRKGRPKIDILPPPH